MINKAESERRINLLKNRLFYYESQMCKYWENYIKLANGDSFKFVIPEYCVAHLLGIDTNYLISTGLFKTTNSYELLKEVCENEYKLYTSAQSGIIDYDRLFSSHIEDKIKGFTENLKVNVYKTDLVCKYDRSKAYLQGEEKYSFDYLIVKHNEFNEYFMLGVSKNNGVYVPVTNQYFETKEALDEKLKKILKNQDITICVAVKNNEMYALNSNLKYQKVSTLIKDASKYQSTVDVSEDYLWTLNKYLEGFNSGKNINLDMADKIVGCIEAKKLITPDCLGIAEEEINSNLEKIIYAVNDLLIGNTTTSYTEATSKYADTINNLQKLKEECEILKNDNAVLNGRVVELEKENSSLKKQCEDQTTIVEQIKKLVL